MFVLLNDGTPVDEAFETMDEVREYVDENLDTNDTIELYELGQKWSAIKPKKKILFKKSEEE